MYFKSVFLYFCLSLVKPSNCILSECLNVLVVEEKVAVTCHTNGHCTFSLGPEGPYSVEVFGSVSSSHYSISPYAREGI